MKHPLRFLWALVPVTLLAVFLVIGCSDTENQSVMAPDTGQPAAQLTAASPVLRSAIEVQERHTPSLMRDSNVVGTAVSLAENREPVILVLLETGGQSLNLPNELEGVAVQPMVSGPVHAFKPPKPPKPPSGGVDHKARQTRPIELGVSGGNSQDLANGYCCSGTLGALVSSGSNLYILSNSHVLAADIASSPSDPDVAELGDGINQPGLIDINCSDLPDDYVATLSSLTSLVPGSNVDAAIAKIISGTVDTEGSILEIGILSSQTTAASIGQKVKKSGRTSGLTRSTVNGLNATITVGYEDECAGSSFSKTFTGQILIKNNGSKFLKSGDSGSLMVEDVTENPRAVGLLYAGSNQIAVANPIDEVLDYLNVSMVGN
jgi:hypothetical protein